MNRSGVGRGGSAPPVSGGRQRELVALISVQPGDAFVHPGGMRAVILAASEERLEFRLTLPPGRGRLPQHTHQRQVETFRVESGEGPYSVDGLEGRAGAGDALEVPAGAPHINPWNDGAGELVYVQSISPVLDFLDIVIALGFRKR